MPHLKILDIKKTALVIVDLQEAFRSPINDFAQIVSRVSVVVRGFQILNLPIIITEQYPKGLGRTAEEIVQLLVDGINETRTKEIPVTIILNEKEAIMHAYNTAKPGSLITIMCDVVAEAIDLIRSLKEKEDAE